MSGKITGNSQTVCPEFGWIQTASHLSVFVTLRVTSQQGGMQSVFR